MGSGGGSAEKKAYLGGRGGGVITISAQKTLELLPNSVVSANAQPGSSATNPNHPSGAGGGSGGSVVITCSQFTQFYGMPILSPLLSHICAIRNYFGKWRGWWK